MQFTDDASVFELKRREDFLAKVRKSPSGQTPSLVRVLREGDQSYSELKLAWIHQGGEGSSVLRNLDEKQQRAAEYLLSKGLIVPTSVSNPAPDQRVKLLKHFDDVRFGVRANGEIAIYELGAVTTRGDRILTATDEHIPAFARVKRDLTHVVAMVDQEAITVNGEKIRPIVSGDQMIIRQRQILERPEPSQPEIPIQSY